jgi:hypothetical protein
MRQRNIGWRLDYIYAPDKLAKAATSCVVERETGTSDHGPVIATFDDKRVGMTRHAHAAATARAKNTERLQQPGLGL